MILRKANLRDLRPQPKSSKVIVYNKSFQDKNMSYTQNKVSCFNIWKVYGILRVHCSAINLMFETNSSDQFL